MATPPNFTGHSHEDMKRLLAAEDRRQGAKRERAFLAQFYGTGALVLCALAIIVYAVVGVFR